MTDNTNPNARPLRTDRDPLNAEGHQEVRDILVVYLEPEDDTAAI